MKTSFEQISPVKKRLLVEVEAGEVDRKIDEAYRLLGKKASVHGFRPGKVPRKILERYFSEQVAEDVTKGLVNETLPKAVEEAHAFPLTTPVVENDMLKAGQSFKYTAVMEVRPQFELKDYMGVEVEKEIVSVTDQDVERQLEEIRKANSQLKPVEGDRAAREGDCVIIDYEGLEADKPLEGIKAQNFQVTLGNSTIHPDFEKGLIGLKIGDSEEIRVDFEANHPNAKLAGKKVNFRVKVVDIKIVELPELNDEFARSLGADFIDLETLRKKIRESIIQNEEKRVDKELKRRLLEKIAVGVDFELPDSLVESELEYAVETVKQNLARMGSTLQKAGFKEEKLGEDLLPAARKRVKELLILGEIARQNELTINDLELNEGFSDLGKSLGQDPQALRQFYEARQLLGSFREKLLEEKTLNYLVNGAKITPIAADQIPRGQE
jgi:trigger factor